MSLNKKNYDKAKKRASERIEKWIRGVEEDEEGNGISRLISNYPGVLRRIQFGTGTRRVVYDRSPSITDIQIAQRRDPYPLKDVNTEKRRVLVQGSREIKLFSASAETIPVHPSSEQRKTNSEGSLSDIRVESQKGRNSRRSSRLSTEDPLRLCLWSSRDQNNEPRSSKLSQYNGSHDNECLEITERESGITPTNLHLSVDNKALLVAPSTTRRRRNLCKTPTSNRRRWSRGNLIVPTKSMNFQDLVTTTVYEKIPEKKFINAGPRLIKFFKKIYNICLLFNCTCRQLSGEFEKHENVFKIIADGEILIFDPHEFRAASKNCAGLTKGARKALEKSPGQREKDDIGCLLELINRLPVFANYSRQVKEALANRLRYDRLRSGRVLVKQGQIGSNVFCVVSGLLGCRMSDVDPRSGDMIMTYLPDIKEGSTFGELALIRDIKRSATVYCKSDCELLVLTRDDFNDVMRKAWEKERRQRLEFLQQSQYFRSWTDDELSAVADVSEINYYSDNDVILGNVKGISPVVSFIMSGTCLVIKQVPMVRLKSPYQTSMYQLPHVTSRKQFLDKTYARPHRQHLLQTHNLTIIDLNEGDYMGVGENLEDIYILAKGKAVCLSMNSVQFEIFAKKKELRAMAEKRQELLPDNAALRRLLIMNRRWNRYKREVVEEVVARRKIRNRATLFDVPWSIRMDPRI